MGLLQRFQSFWECLGGVRGSEGRALSQKLSPWLNFLNFSFYVRNQACQGPGPLTLPPNNPAPIECSLLRSPTLLPYQTQTGLSSDTGMTDDVESLARGYWGVKECKERNSQILTPTPHLLKLCHKFCSEIPFHQSIKRGRNHCGSSEEGSRRTSFRVAFIQETPTTRPAEAMWFPLACYSQKSSVYLRSAYAPSCKYVLSVWPLFLDCNFMRVGHLSHRIFCPPCQEPSKAWKVFAKWVTNHKECLEMKELKSRAEIRNKIFKSRIRSFLPGNQLWSSKQQTGLWYPRCPMNVYVDQS